MSSDGGPRIRLRTESSDRESTASEVEITRWRDVGQMVEGKFSAMMRAGINEQPRKVTGTFRLCRAKDRHSP